MSFDTFNSPVINQSADPSKDNYATISLALGVINLIGACCISWIPLLGCLACLVPPLAIVGLVLGYMGLQSNQRQFAQIGLGLNGFALLAYMAIFALSFIFGFASALSDTSSFIFFLS